jgi:hypothetical protein
MVKFRTVEGNDGMHINKNKRDSSPPLGMTDAPDDGAGGDADAKRPHPLPLPF